MHVKGSSCLGAGGTASVHLVGSGPNECTRQAPTRRFVTQRSLYGMVPLRPATAVMCHRRYHAGLCWSSEYMLTSGLPWWCVGHMPVGFSVGFRDVRVCVGS